MKSEVADAGLALAVGHGVCRQTRQVKAMSPTHVTPKYLMILSRPYLWYGVHLIFL